MKIFKLFINENIKTWKKLSTKILIIAIFISLIAVLGLVKLMQSTETDEVISSYTEEDFINEEIEYFTEQLKNENLDEDTRLMIQQELETYKLYLEYDVSPYENTWKNDMIDQIAIAKVYGEGNIEELEKMLKDEDFTKYMEQKKQELKTSLENKEITEEEYNDDLVILELKEKYEIGKDEDQEYWKTAIITEIKQCQTSIRTGINQSTRKVLKAEEKSQLEDLIKIDMYRLENNIPDAENGSDDNYRMRFEMLAPMFTIAVISIAIIVIAGGTISTEVSNGTIKFWALTPNKRWKIMTAKLLSILFYIIIITLITSILSVAIANTLFEEEGEVYLYVQNGEVQEIGNTLYTIEYYLLKTIPVMMFALFAVMLSTITRNTAVAVSISMALYMGNGIVMQIISLFIKKDWLKFVPFNNLNIVDKVFANSTSLSSLMFESSYTTSTTLGFSLAVLGVCAILMLITIYDSFNKRDII